jgi:transposase InsO family protein
VREWFTAQELAGLPGTPETLPGVRYRAKSEGWQKRKRAKGKGFEYHINSLPPLAQAELAKREFRKSPAGSSSAGGSVQHQADGRSAPAASGAAVSQGGEAAAPFEYDPDSLWRRFERQSARRKKEAEALAVAVDSALAMIDRDIPARVAWAKAGESVGKSRATLQRWHEKIRKYHRSDWPAAALRNYRGRTATASFSRKAWDYLISDYLRQERPTLSACYDRLRRTAEAEGWEIPPERTVRRRVENYCKQYPTRLALLREGEGMLMRMYPDMQRTVADLHALEWINGDGYQHNVFVEWPDGTIARPKTWFWQDVYSRKIVGFRTDETEHSDMIRLALGDVVERFGIPRHATIDNTRAAANKWLTGGVPNRYRFTVREDEPLGLLPSLGVQVHWTSVHNGRGHGQAKPIERAFQSRGGLGDYVDRAREFEGAFCGEDPTKKPENYGQRAVPFDEFVAVLVREIRAWNARIGRRTEICAGKLSYDQAFEESYRKSEIRKATAAQRRLWLMKAEQVRGAHDGTVMLQAGGVVGVGKNRYGSEALHPYIGQKVAIRFDPHALHGEVYAYSAADEYLGPCECIAAHGYGDTVAGRKHNRARKQWMNAEKQKAEAMRLMSAAEATRLMPDIDEPEDPEPGVTAIDFRDVRRAVGSDVNPDQGETGDGPAEKDRRREAFRNAVSIMAKQRDQE